MRMVKEVKAQRKFWDSTKMKQQTRMWSECETLSSVQRWCRSGRSNTSKLPEESSSKAGTLCHDGLDPRGIHAIILVPYEIWWRQFQRLQKICWKTCTSQSHMTVPHLAFNERCWCEVADVLVFRVDRQSSQTWTGEWRYRLPFVRLQGSMIVQCQDSLHKIKPILRSGRQSNLQLLMFQDTSETHASTAMPTCFLCTSRANEGLSSKPLGYSNSIANMFRYLRQCCGCWHDKS